MWRDGPVECGESGDGGWVTITGVGLPPPVAKSYPHSSQNRSLDGVPQSGQGFPDPTACICTVGLGAPVCAAPASMRSPQTSQ
ncbi:hypothetical protein GCM10010411_03310 [Actinomadura fulvescens]|uniref:Uncharacterized protein n=2 Tax=Actinomadura fulvescens TaxID=46160 RepID=A0ABN3PAS0_9ACTN